MGMETVPVTLADELTPAQIKAFRLTANHSVNWSHWNAEMLEHELKDLGEMGFDVEPFGLDEILPELEDLEEVVAPKRTRTKQTIFVSVAIPDVEKARKAIVAALARAGVAHNL
jgi:hypothetical protein